MRKQTLTMNWVKNTKHKEVYEEPSSKMPVIGSLYINRWALLTGSDQNQMDALTSVPKTITVTVESPD